MQNTPLLLLFASAIALGGCDRDGTRYSAPESDDSAPTAQQVPDPVEPEPLDPAIAPPLEMTPEPGFSARATLEPTEGNSAAGELRFSVDNGLVRVSGSVSGLTPNAEHGFHIHETGDCSAPDASSAGEHFDPGSQPHGDRRSGPHHAGDMPNLRADADGSARVEVTLDDVQIGSGGENDVLGRAAIVHRQPDDYSTQPSGNAGARIACGVIVPDPR